MSHPGPPTGTRVRNVVILACAVDAADKALLPATFKALAQTMQVGPKELGALTFAQSIAFSLALPVWGSLLRLFPARQLLVAGCCLWSASTLLISLTSTFGQQFLLRLVNGAALAAVNPLGQAVLCDVIPEAERGRAFGLVASASSAMAMLVGAGATATASESIGGLAGWRLAHILMSSVSFTVAFLIHIVIPLNLSPPAKPTTGSWIGEQKQVIKMILNKPSFVILVLQGVTGGIPWNGFAFLTLFFQLSGYTDMQTGQIVFYGGIGGAVGGYLGGYLGDHLGLMLPNTGRVATAQASVLLGTFFFVWVMYVPFQAGSFFTVSLAYFLFNLTAVWTPAAACRPICGSIFRDSRDRAQVLALWIALEGISASVLGAPLAGVLSEAFGFRLTGAGPHNSAADESSLGALRRALMGVAIVPWVLCFLAWVPMYWTLPQDRCEDDQAAKDSEPEDSNETSGLRGAGRGETCKPVPVQVGVRSE